MIIIIFSIKVFIIFACIKKNKDHDKRLKTVVNGQVTLKKKLKKNKK